MARSLLVIAVCLAVLATVCSYHLPTSVLQRHSLFRQAGLSIAQARDDGLSDPGSSLAVPPECLEFANSIKAGTKQVTYQDTIDFLDQHYIYLPVPFKCGDLSYEPGVKTGAAKIFSFALMVNMSEAETLRLFGEFYRNLSPGGVERPNIRNFVKGGWGCISFESGLAIVSKASKIV
jgi:hypothetical protein